MLHYLIGFSDRIKIKFQSHFVHKKNICNKYSNDGNQRMEKEKPNFNKIPM